MVSQSSSTRQSWAVHVLDRFSCHYTPCLWAIILPAMLHILAGNAAEDVGLILEAAKSGKAVSWIVPKKAHPNDRALFHLPSLGFEARGVIASEPEQDEPGRYGANVQAVTLLPSAVPLAFILKKSSGLEMAHLSAKLRDN